MRILAVTPYYDPEGGGLERYAQAVLTRLASRGHQVALVCCTRQNEHDGDRQGVAVSRRRPFLTLGNAPVDPQFASVVSRKIHEMRPDVVVAHTPVPFPAEMAFLAARRAGIPFVTTYHAGSLRAASPFLQGPAALHRWTLERAMLRGSERLIAVTDFVKENVLGAQQEKVSVIPPGVDASRFRPGGGGDGRTILFVGPLSHSYHWKGLDVLLEAFPRVRERFPEARLALVGDGDRAPALRSRIERTGEDVALLGRLDDDALIAAYQDAAVVVLPSTSDAESFGMVLAEANACGRPVVGSRIGGIPCFIRHGDNGLLAAPGDPVDLAEMITEVLQDRRMADAMGERGRERVVREHDWDRISVETERVLESAVAGRQGRAAGSIGPAKEDRRNTGSLQSRAA